MNAPNGVNLGLGLDRIEQSMARERLEDAIDHAAAPGPEGRTRETFLGGSECAAVLGVSPWATALDVYFSKTGTRPPAGAWRDPQREKNFKRGKRAEPHAIVMAKEDLGLKVTKVSTPEAKNYYVDAEHPFLACEIDFEWEVTPEIAARYPSIPEELIGTIQNGEVKSVHPFAAGKFGEAETDEVPIEYGAQAMHGLMITGRELTMFLVLTGWDDLSVYWIRRDDETIAGIRTIEVKFWKEHVEPRVPPEPRTLPDVMNLFRRVGAFRVTASEETAAKIAKLDSMRRAARVAAEQLDELQFEIGCEILGKEAVERPEDAGQTLVVDKDGKPILVIAFQQQFDLNEAKLKAQYPAVAEACAKMQQFFVYRIPKPKKADGASKSKKGKSEEEAQT